MTHAQNVARPGCWRQPKAVLGCYMANSVSGADRKISRQSYDGAAGNWDMLRVPPHPALSPYVIDYSGYRESGGKEVWRRELPCSFIPLIINFDIPFTI